MKLKLPKNWNEVTVGQFIQLLPSSTKGMSETQQTAHVLSVLSLESKEDIYKMSLEDIKKYNKKLEFLSQPLPQGKHKEQFKLLGKWYKVEPNANKLSGGQYIRSMQVLKDLANDPDTIDKNLHLILANIIIPMERKGFKLVQLTEYDNKELAQVFFDALPISIAYPIIVFFCSLSNVLTDFMEDYSTAKITEVESQLLTIQKDLQSSSDGL